MPQIELLNAVDEEQRIRKKNKKKHRIIIVFVLLACMVGLCSRIITDMEISDDPEILSCEATIAQGDSLAALHLYDTALLTYQSAIDNYTAEYRKSHFQDVVTKKRQALLKEALDECTQKSDDALADSLPSAANCLLVKTLINTLPSDSILYEEEILMKEKELELVWEKLNQRIGDKTNDLLIRISANYGKMDKQMKSEVDTLLLCSPDDYWLNIIKKKAK